MLCNFVDAIGKGWNSPKLSFDIFETTASLEDAAEILYHAQTMKNVTFSPLEKVLVDDFNTLMSGKLP